MDDVILYAKSLLGVPYLWGGRSSFGIDCSGLIQTLLSFENNGLPTITTKAAPQKESSSRSSRDRRESSKKDDKKSTPTPTKAHIVQVPSRRPQIDPRIIEKGLEYLSKADDQEKKEYIMKRLESLQSGQHKIKSDQDQNERRRQYDEWRKRREAGK